MGQCLMCCTETLSISDAQYWNKEDGGWWLADPLILTLSFSVHRRSATTWTFKWLWFWVESGLFSIPSFFSIFSLLTHSAQHNPPSLPFPPCLCKFLSQACMSEVLAANAAYHIKNFTLKWFHAVIIFCTLLSTIDKNRWNSEQLRLREPWGRRHTYTFSY